MLKLLEKLCYSCAPSGIEDAVRAIILAEIKPYATSYRIDAVGNLIVFKKGKEKPSKKLLYSAHMDEVGFMITHICDNGYLYFDTVGGIDRRVIAGRRILIGPNQLKAVIASKPIHLQSAEERGVCEPVSSLYIDLGCDSAEQASKLVQIGDCAVFEPNFKQFGESRIVSKAIDDRFGCAALCSMIKSDLAYDSYFAFCTCEEVGCRGAQGVAFSEKADLIVVVEATTAGDIHGVSDALCACKLGNGAVLSFMDGGTLYDKNLVAKTMTLAKEASIPCQLKNLVAGGNDASVYQRADTAAKVLAVSAPTRYIHSPCCVADLEDLKAVVKLLEEINRKVSVLL